MAQKIRELDGLEEFKPNKKQKHFIDESLIKEMLSKIDIVDVLNNVYGIEFESRGGDEYRTHCPYPDHRDSDPSFDVNSSKGVYKCWGCGRSGNLITFMTKVEGIPFYEAINRISELSGITIKGFDTETARVLYNLNKIVNDYLNRYAETPFPAGMSEIEFFKAMNSRIKDYEKQIENDENEIKWIDKVYFMLDDFSSKEKYKLMVKMWDELSVKLKERYKKYVEQRSN